MTQFFDLNARIQQLTWSLIFYEKYSTSLSTIILVVLTTANFGGFSNFCRYCTRSQTCKSTGYRPTLKPLYILFLSCPSVRHTVVHITRKFWLPEFCWSYAPLNLEISQNLLLKQLVSATPLKLLNRISWNLVGSKDTICSCAYYQKILIAWSLWELCPFEHRTFPKFSTVY